MITIIDYGLGNVLAILNVFKRLHIPAGIAKSSHELTDATKLVLPGVGHFDHAMSLFNASGLRDPVTDLVMARKLPIIGVCVGMQMLANRSEEGSIAGLGWVPGEVRKIDATALTYATRLPHMGWNHVEPVGNSPLFNGLEMDSRFYFLHSYCFAPSDPNARIASATYGESFACAVQHKNVFGVQFHPEKSHHWGSKLFQNFAELEEC